MPAFRFKDLYIAIADPAGRRGDPIIEPSTLICEPPVALKADLYALLAKAENENAGHPQTVDEVEMLEKRLKGTLDELRTYKEELKKRAA